MVEEERRKFTRVPFETEVKISWGNQTTTFQRLLNVSLGGLLVAGDNGPAAGTTCSLEISVKGRTSLLTIHAEGEVIRVKDGTTAIAFTSMDVDSLVHLRHIIQIMAEKPELIDMEFTRNLLCVE